MNDTESRMEAPAQSGISRRRFFGYAGALAGAGLLMSTAGCKKDDDDDGINLGSNDVGVLNYAYALEQLEAAFYIRVTQSFYSGITANEQAYFSDIRDHEIAHREFFKTALAGNAIQGLTPDFSSVNFNDRTSVLETAKAFEDLGVSAYNGAGKLLTNPDYLLIAGKIVSVEARHAAAVRDLISNGTFAGIDVVNAQGLDVSRTPAEVLAIAGTFIKEKLNAGNLPKS